MTHELLPQWQKDLIDERMLVLAQYPDLGVSLEAFLIELKKEDDSR